jgi:hypothetical protein
MADFIKKLMEDRLDLNKEIALYNEERDYLEKYNLLANDEKTSELKSTTRFEDAYIERSNKETEEVIAIETSSFLNQPVHYLKEHKEEFLYVESKWFELIGVDAISLEVDDVFGAYDVMLGLKLQRKFEKSIKTYLNEEFVGKDLSYDLMFNQNDGLWDLNFTLDNLKGFNEELTLGEAYSFIYRFLLQLVDSVEVSDRL